MKRYETTLTHFRSFLSTEARTVRKLSQLTKPVLLRYRDWRLAQAFVRPSRGMPAVSPNGAEVPVAEAAKLLEYTHSTTLKLVKTGLLDGRMVRGARRFDHYLVTRKSIEAYKASPRYARGLLSTAARTKRPRATKAPKQRHLRNRTINVEISMLWTLLNKAVEWGLIEDNPVTSTKGLRLPEHDSVQFRALTDAEFDRFRRACPDWLLPPLLAMAFLGLREEEARQLEWSDLDLVERVVRLRNKPTLRLKSQGHTGVRQVDLPIPDELFPVLSELHSRRGGFEDDLVFHNSVGRQFAKGALRARFAFVMERCDIRDITQVHALRKTFITHLARGEKNIFLVQHLARHRDVRTTGRYVTIFDDDKLRAMRSMSIGTRRGALEAGVRAEPTPAPKATE